MTGREKMEAAFSAEGTPEIPAVVPYEDIFIRDHWDELTDLPWWYREAPDLEHQLAWRRKVITEVGQDWFRLPRGSSRKEREEIFIEERPEGVYRVNRRTGERERLRRPPVGGEVIPGGSRPLPEDFEDVEDAIPPPDDSPPDSVLRDGRGDLAGRLLEEFGGTFLPYSPVDSPLWSCYSLWGFEGLMVMVGTKPELVKFACERFLAHAVRSVREWALLGSRAVWIEECMTDMISPAAFKELSLPYARRLVDEIRNLGMKSIYYFCGNPFDRWNEVLSVGADALAFEESKKGFRIDIEDVVERVRGRFVVFGNLDAVGSLERGSDAELRQEISRQIAAGRRNKGRFVMSLGSPVTPGTPVGRVKLYCELVHELGR